MGKIGDLFVRLGLKKDEFSRGMKGAAKDSEAFAKTMQAVGKAVKMAWAGLSAAIVREMTEEIKREAERHGHSLTVAAMNEAKRQAGQAPGGSKKKPLN